MWQFAPYSWQLALQSTGVDTLCRAFFCADYLKEGKQLFAKFGIIHKYNTKVCLVE